MGLLHLDLLGFAIEFQEGLPDFALQPFQYRIKGIAQHEGNKDERERKILDGNGCGVDHIARISDDAKQPPQCRRHQKPRNGAPAQIFQK